MKLNDMVAEDLAGPGAVLEGIRQSPPDGNLETDILGLSADSRLIKPGFVFAALSGSQTDGTKFVADAIRRGAVAIVADMTVPIDVAESIPVLRVHEPRQVLAKLSAAFYKVQPETIAAVTGTSGKTSVAEFTRQIFSHLNWPAASLGTIGVVTQSGADYGSLTTPDPVSLHETLQSLARGADHITHVALEASSHGLDQFRLDGVKLSAGAFTNLGRDHLDYHPTVEAYFEAKMRLFSELLQPGQPAVVNVDAPFGQDVVEIAGQRGLQVFSVGRAGNTLKLIDVEQVGFKQRMTVRYEDVRFDIELPLIGAYQVDNALIAAGIALALDGQPKRVFYALEKLRGVPGRLEIVGEHQGGLVVVDYAHKPEALAAALSGVRPFVTGRLICVFGCGGDRDSGKRAMMGEIAIKDADMVIVTDDNPRTENAASIRRQILGSAPGAIEIADRRAAIGRALQELGPGDVALIAGKGHETGQIVGNDVLPFSDHEEARAIMQNSSPSYPSHQSDS